MSGKGGVGKSSIAAHLAYALAHSSAAHASHFRRFDQLTGLGDASGCQSPLQVALLDIDICGPSIPIITVSSRARVGCFSTLYEIRMIVLFSFYRD